LIPKTKKRENVLMLEDRYPCVATEFPSKANLQSERADAGAAEWLSRAVVEGPHLTHDCRAPCKGRREILLPLVSPGV
jgi:hypothetical protein